LIWQIGTSDEASHVTAEFNDESGAPNEEWAATGARTLGLRGRLLKLFEVRSKQLLQIGKCWRLPGDGENFPARRCILADYCTRGRSQFVDCVVLRLGYVERCVDVGLIRSHG